MSMGYPKINQNVLYVALLKDYQNLKLIFTKIIKKEFGI
jgi:hypothetical protein